MCTTQHTEACQANGGLPVSESQVLSWAEAILQARFARCSYLTSPALVRDYLRMTLSTEEREVFGIILLDSQHGVLRFERLFYGTIDSASVYPREIVKAALNSNAAAVILAHNHPSGDPTPSQADIDMTQEVADAAETLGIVLHDHIIISRHGHTSFKEMELLCA